MIGRVKTSWRLFKKSRPGHRFQDRYRRRQRSGGGGFNLRRVLYIAGGTILVVASALGGLAPVLGWGTFFIGLGLIAGEFRPVARLLDWAEVRARRLMRWARRVWAKSPGAVRVAICLLAIALVLVLAYGAYRLLFGA